MQHQKKNRSLYNLWILTALLFICNSIYSQNQTGKNKILNVPAVQIDHVSDTLNLFPEDSLGNDPSSPVPAEISNNKFHLFLDSLKVKASKNLITKKLFDFIVVSNKPVTTKQITGSSDQNFLRYSGKKIRKIEIIRLNAFGTNINSPLYYDPNNIEALLNKTHIKTNEFIIRKSLLFSEGDTISPLIFSDNERLLRKLPFIDDVRIIILAISDKDADIVVITKDLYSLGGNYNYKGINRGVVSLFEKNVLGMGHELDLEVPYDARATNSMGFGITYSINNISRTFLNLDLNFYNALEDTHYGFRISRDLISATTKYAGGISVLRMSASEDLDSLLVPQPLKYNLQNYWFMRSFLINKESVSRAIFGIRYINNNVSERPFILPFSFHELQKYRIFLGSASLSIQKYYITNLIYNYGRTEDIPYGGLIRMTAGKEINEFKDRTYIGVDAALGKSSRELGYFYLSSGLGAFFNKGKSEQGILKLGLNYFSNLLIFRNYLIRNFMSIDYTRGFSRYTDEHLYYRRENGLSGFRNDSVNGTQRVTVSLESVIFSPANFYGFRFSFFAFADASFLAETNQLIKNGSSLSGIGLGMRIRNNNLVVNTFQLRIGFFPNLPAYSRVNYLILSGEQLLRPNTFDPGPPSIIPYR